MAYETPSDIAEEVADLVSVYGEKRQAFVSTLISRMRDAVHVEDAVARHTFACRANGFDGQWSAADAVTAVTTLARTLTDLANRESRNVS